MFSEEEEVGIVGTGIYVPATRELVRDIAARYSIQPGVVEKSGAAAVSVAGRDESASDMAIIAGRRAVEASGQRAADVGLIIYCGDHKDYVKWQAATRVQDALGAPRAVCFDLYQSCNSQVLGWQLAARAIHAGDCDWALVVAAEKYGASVPRRVIGNGIFVGDGAAATVIGRAKRAPRPVAKLLAFAFASNGAYHDMMYVKHGGVIQPGHERAQEDDTVYLVRRRLNAEELSVFLEAVERTALELLDRACASAGVARDDIDVVVTLNGNDGHNRRFIEAAGLTKARNTRAFISEVGHLGAADTAYNLHRARESGLAHDGDLVAIYSGGAGYSWAVTLLKVEGVA